MIVVSVVVVFALIGALVFQQYSFSKLLEREREGTASERQELLQRIQAPDSAVAAHAERVYDGPVPRLFVNFDDDEDFDNYRSSMEG